MVARIAVQNINAVNLTKIMLLRIRTKDIRNARVKATPQKRENPRFFITRIIRPLLFIFKMRTIWVLIICRV